MVNRLRLRYFPHFYSFWKSWIDDFCPGYKKLLIQTTFVSEEVIQKAKIWPHEEMGFLFTLINWATMLTAISSGVSELMSRPIGA